MELLRADGWVVYRSAGSHGPADLVAMRAGAIMLVQVKSCARSAFDHFPPHERAALLLEAGAAGARPILCWWPPRVRVPSWIEETAWPRPRVAAAA